MAGLFLGTLAMLNILGVSRFIAFAGYTPGEGVQWGGFGEISFAVAIGVLPYPVTFLCTDLISEFYGRRRATFLVWVGLLLNLWVVAILWVAGALPGTEADAFFEIRKLAFGAVAASMIAYLAAQFVDVYVFHFWKKLTRGKHLWLRNNGSTMVSQLVDTVAVILITWRLGGLDDMIQPQTSLPAFLSTLIFTGYAFKFIAAAFDTPIVYLAVRILSPYLQIDPTQEHVADDEQTHLDEVEATR